ncbi:MAG: copper chaperone [Dehalococcoidia bacterium]|nr:copper chaperone [Dehalococcoidia bacterium]
MQMLLSSPEITCDHCIATIRNTVETTAGVRFISGDPDARTFVIDATSGTLLDALGAALAAAGYPLGDIPAGGGDAHGTRPPGWRPAGYRIERTAVGANVNYDCFCGCDAGFALDRSNGAPAPESCCCGNRMLVGAHAAARLAAVLDAPERYRIDVQPVVMPWGQPLEAAVAIPLDG